MSPMSSIHAPVINSLDPSGSGTFQSTECQNTTVDVHHRVSKQEEGSMSAGDISEKGTVPQSVRPLKRPNGSSERPCSEALFS